MELEVLLAIKNGVTIHCDNMGAIAQSKKPRSHQKSKHVLRRFHFIKEIVERKEVIIEKIPKEDNLVDSLTKGLTQQKHDRHTREYGVQIHTSWL